MRRFFQGEKGMTLMEAIVAVMLIAVTMLSVLLAVTQSVVFSKKADILYTASYLAQRRIDVIKRFDFSALKDAEENDVRVGADGTQDVNGDYLRSTEVTESYDLNPLLAKVKVTVKRTTVTLDGTARDEEGKMQTVAQPVVIETLFADI